MTETRDFDVPGFGVICDVPSISSEEYFSSHMRYWCSAEDIGTGESWDLVEDPYGFLYCLHIQ